MKIPTLLYLYSLLIKPNIFYFVALFRFQDIRDALGNIADLNEFSRDLVRDASEAGPSGSSLFTDTTPVRPLESAEDFGEIEELADDSDNFKVCV